MLHGSREFLRVRLTITPATVVDVVNINTVSVDLRLAGGDPAWRSAEVTLATLDAGIGTVHARLLIGSGTALDPAVGEHRVLARVTTGTEVVVVEARPWLSVAST